MSNFEAPVKNNRDPDAESNDTTQPIRWRQKRHQTSFVKSALQKTAGKNFVAHHDTLSAKNFMKLVFGKNNNCNNIEEFCLGIPQFYTKMPKCSRTFFLWQVTSFSLTKEESSISLLKYG
ncbi:MAG: hypothetical protein GY820_26965 [Gammaproteobacteria bacterium]|nr:hypothetical protein [Gammaproteobacteria bacterium]